MDRTLDIRTPESIAFSCELAGLGSRFLAVAIDLCVQLAVLALVLWGFYLIGTHEGSSATPKETPEMARFLANVAIGLAIFLVFAIFFGYFIAFEAIWNGQTPGKKALGIRVARDGGYPLDWGASLIRNLVRIGEMALGFYASSAICALASRENKRLGDLAAGTIVVRDSRMDRPGSLRESWARPSYAATGFVSGEERSLIHRFLDRRDRLETQKRTEIAAQLAQRVRERVPLDLQRLDDESLLERL